MPSENFLKVYTNKYLQLFCLMKSTRSWLNLVIILIDVINQKNTISSNDLIVIIIHIVLVFHFSSIGFFTIQELTNITHEINCFQRYTINSKVKKWVLWNVTDCNLNRFNCICGEVRTLVVILWAGRYDLNWQYSRSRMLEIHKESLDIWCRDNLDGRIFCLIKNGLDCIPSHVCFIQHMIREGNT